MPITSKAAKRREYEKRAAQRKLGTVSSTQLLAEGLKEIGRVGSIGYALTDIGLHLFHRDAIPATGRAVDVRIPGDLVVSAVEAPDPPWTWTLARNIEMAIGGRS